MTLAEKIADILNLDPSHIEVDYNNKTDYEISILSDVTGCSKLFAKVNDGNTMYVNHDNKSDEYRKIFEAADNSLYNAILAAYDENRDFIDKYENIIENQRKVIFYLKEPYFYYNKRSKKLYAIPTIKVSTVAASFQFQFAPSVLSKIDKTIDAVHEQFYSQRLQGFLEKPLNKYTPEELTLLHMIKI